MVNFFDYSHVKRVKVTDIDNAVFIGHVIEVIDDDDEWSNGEDGISIEIADGQIIGLARSEIKSIEILEK